MSALPLSFVPVFLGLALHIAGCAAPLSPQAQSPQAQSPQAQCFAAATVDYRAAWRAAEVVRTDLDRGYALHRVAVRQAQAVPCRVQDRLKTCLQQGHDTLALPAPIDRRALEKQLAVFEARMDRLRPTAMARAAPCGYGETLAEAGGASAVP